LSIHLCICLICVCVSSNNIRSNIKLWNGFKLFLNSTSRSLSCPVAIKDFYHKDRTPALNPWLSLTSWSLAQKLCRSAVRLASAIALRSTWGPVCSAMKYERVPRSDAIPTTFPFIYFTFVLFNYFSMLQYRWTRVIMYRIIINFGWNYFGYQFKFIFQGNNNIIKMFAWILGNIRLRDNRNSYWPNFTWWK
jgi:hypothetical protein